MLPSIGGVELRLATHILVGDSLRGKVCFWSFWMLLLKLFWGVQVLKIEKVLLLLFMIGLRRVLWGIFLVDLSAVWEHYWTTTSMCALAGLLASEILYWRWGIHTYIYTNDKILSLWVSQLPFCCWTLCCACIML